MSSMIFRRTDENKGDESVVRDLELEETSNSSSNSVVLEAENDKNLKSNEKCPPGSNSVLFEAENYFLHREIEKLKAEIEQLKNRPFGFHSLKDNVSALHYYTGSSPNAFKIIVNLCAASNFKYYNKWKVQCLSLEDQILITLMKLRHSFTLKDLSFRFNCGTSTVSNIILTFIIVLHRVLYLELMNDVPSKDKKAEFVPNCFISSKNSRMIVDCTEFQCEEPHKIDEQKATHSNYKHMNSLKCCAGVAPSGVFTYCSNLYPGSVPDKEIVERCRLVKIFKPGDLIFADKGLLNDVVPKDVSVNTPSFFGIPQCNPDETEATNNIDKAHLLIGRAFHRLKCYKILKLIPKSLYEHSSKIFQLCAALTNFQNFSIEKADNSSQPENLHLSDSENELDEIVLANK